MSLHGVERVATFGVLALLTACGVPTAENARLRPPPNGARTVFEHPFGPVYAASKAIIEAEQQTPEWKELEIRVDDPDAGVLIAERRLSGAIPGLAVRDLWSFYVSRVDDDRTAVTFVIESSDRPKPTVGARSWAQGNGTIFPAMRRILAESESDVPRVAAPPSAPRAAAPPPSAPQVAALPPSAPREATERKPAPKPTEPAPGALATTRTQPTSILDRVYAALQRDTDWRATARLQTYEGERLVLIGAWAQLSADGERVRIVFPSYPAPPAYDVASVMRFLADAGFTVEVLPGSAFRSL